ncbi:hypothetical protein C2845_PM17G10790 [Panicum miliaceum]|uniref:Uncharacterized protein n=1 Tax=Panicum miliaceum TaxID=4540 RepID=A0A3L6Q3Y9_PANMI|nr:hypothetical protein C2845_PM17G10790 [Panicum miliaceum]
MEKLLEDTRPSVEMARWKQRSIYRAPEWIKKMTNRDAYQPQLVSPGPLHQGEPHLLPMEEHKRRAVLHMVKRAGKPLAEFVAAIEEVADELEAAYHDLDDIWRGAKQSLHWEGSDKYEPRTPCAVELNKAGIQFKRSRGGSGGCTGD